MPQLSQVSGMASRFPHTRAQNHEGFLCGFVPWCETCPSVRGTALLEPDSVTFARRVRIFSERPAEAFPSVSSIRLAVRPALALLIAEKMFHLSQVFEFATRVSFLRMASMTDCCVSERARVLAVGRMV